MHTSVIGDRYTVNDNVYCGSLSRARDMTSSKRVVMVICFCGAAIWRMAAHYVSSSGFDSDIESHQATQRTCELNITVF